MLAIAAAYFFVTGLVLAITAKKSRQRDDGRLPHWLFRAATVMTLVAGPPALWFAGGGEGDPRHAGMTDGVDVPTIVLLTTVQLCCLWLITAASSLVASALAHNATPGRAALLTFIAVQITPAAALGWL